MDLVDTWFCIIGTLLIGVGATIWWGNGNKTAALWCVAFPGVVMLLVAAGLQIQHRFIEKKSNVALEEAPNRQQSPANLQKPELRLSMSGANVFTPDAQDVRERLTGIALNVKVWNTGTPCVATDWSLAVIAQGKTPALAQLTRIPEHLSLGGPINSTVIHASDALDVKTSANPISTQLVDGTLLFYVQMKRAVVLQKSTRLELAVTDIYGTKTLTSQIMGDWLGR
jgi:hypothetical protein